MDVGQDDRIRQLEEQVRQLQEQLKLQSQNQVSTSSFSSLNDQSETVQPTDSQQHREQNKEDNNEFLTKSCTSAKNEEKTGVKIFKTANVSQEPHSPQRQVSLGKKSAFKPDQFPKRTGTVDHGKKFEELMCGLYALKFSVDAEVEDFQMTSNSAECGDFDDIEIKVKFKDGNKQRFMIQLKHKDNTSILKKSDFEKEKGPYSVKKYFESISTIEGDDNDVFILYTNNNVNLDADSSFRITTDEGEDTIVAEKCAHFEQLLLNSTKRLVFEFRSKNTNKTIYLFAQQDNLGAVEFKLRKMLQEFLNCDVYNSLTYYLHKWWSQNYILTKHDFIAKLTELALSPFIKHFSSMKVNDKTKILTQAIMEFEMTIVKDNVVQLLWQGEENNDFKKCLKKFALSENDKSTPSKVSWFLEKTPLIIKVNQENEIIVKSVLMHLKPQLRRKKILLVGNLTSGDFKDWDVFESLADLSRKPVPEVIRFQIMENFKVSFQGRPEISLQEIINIDKDMAQHVKTAELFEMSQKQCYLIGHKQTELPKFHIPRSVYIPRTKKILREENIFDNSDPLNVFCAPPGMGKSRMMHVLSNNCPPDSWAFYIGLINCSHLFAKYSGSEKNDHGQMKKLLDEILMFGETAEKNITKQVKRILLKQNKVQLFLDGLDEVDSKHLDLVLNCVDYMKKRGLNVWISSRENLRGKLEETLKVKPMDIQELNKVQQEKYLHERLQKRYKKNQIEKILSTVFKSVDVNNSRQLLETPLQLHIITEIFLHNENAFEEVEKQNMFVLTKMYKLFFESKDQIKHEKLGIDKNQITQLGSAFEFELEQYEIPAIISCFNDENAKKLQIDKTKSEPFLTKIKAQGDKNGIIHVNRHGDLIFEHQTFAEYFACVWLKKNREKVVLLKDTFFTPRYDNLRKIFDIMMAENNPLHLAVIYQNLSEVEKFVHTNCDEKDEGGRLAFHLACTYGNFLQLSQLIFYFFELEKVERETSPYINVVDVLAAKLTDVRQRDVLFQFDCLEYSLYRGSLYPIDRLVEMDVLTLEEIKRSIHLHDFKILVFTVYATKLGYNNLLIKVLQQSPEMAYQKLQMANSEMYLLHMAIKGCTNERNRNLKLVEIILDKLKDRNINNMYQKNNIFGPKFNPLDYAAYHGCYDMFAILMQNGAKCSGGNTILHHLIKKEHFNETVFKLIQSYDVNIAAQNLEGQTALHVALKNGSFNNAQFLLENETDATIEDYYNNTSLHYLMLSPKENTEMLQLLLTKGININAQNKDGETALHLASEKKFLDSAKILFENGLDATIKDDIENTPLHYLMKSAEENTEMLKLLIMKGVNVNAQNKEGKTALHLACERGFLESGKILLENGADEMILDNTKCTVLHYLLQTENQNFELAKSLMKNSLQPNIPNEYGQTPLHHACITRSVKNVQFLHSQGTDFTTASNDGDTPLHFAAMSQNENVAVIDFILQQDININVRNHFGQTPLHFACRYGCFKNVKHLHRHNADFAVVDDHGYTPLHFAAKHKNENIKTLDFLLKQGINVNARTKHCSTPINIACEHSCLKNVEYLHRQHADLTIADLDGDTPLHNASQTNDENYEIINFLLQQSVDFNACNKDGETPLLAAHKRGCCKNARYLCERGADLTHRDQRNMLDYIQNLDDFRDKETLLSYLKQKGLENKVASEYQERTTTSHSSWDKPTSSGF